MTPALLCNKDIVEGTQWAFIFLCLYAIRELHSVSSSSELISDLEWTSLAEKLGDVKCDS